jgi:hypothetical protein
MSLAEKFFKNQFTREVRRSIHCVFDAATSVTETKIRNDLTETCSFDDCDSDVKEYYERVADILYDWLNQDNQYAHN